MVSLCVLPEVTYTHASIQEYGLHFSSKENNCLTFYFKIIVDLPIVVTNNTEQCNPYALHPVSPIGDILHNDSALQSGS